MQLLLQFHHPDAGQITIDGRDIHDYSLESFRANFAIVPQEVILFGGTIRENIEYGKPGATDEEIIAAAREANAWEFISTFPEKLETVVGERGVKLSGGQRQRIAIARAILRDPSVLLLDEATSSLDAESEKGRKEALNRLIMGRTSIIIAPAGDDPRGRPDLCHGRRPHRRTGDPRGAFGRRAGGVFELGEAAV